VLEQERGRNIMANVNVECRMHKPAPPSTLAQRLGYEGRVMNRERESGGARVG
jgi:hypothetical protein